MVAIAMKSRHRVAVLPREKRELPPAAAGLERALEELGYALRFNARASQPELRRAGDGAWERLQDRSEAQLRERIAETFDELLDDPHKSKRRLFFGRDRWRHALNALLADREEDPFCVWLEEPKAALLQSVDPAGRQLTGRALQRRVGPGDNQAARRGRGTPTFHVLPHVPGDGDHQRTCRTGEPSSTRSRSRGTPHPRRRSSTTGRRTESPSTRSNAS